MTKLAFNHGLAENIQALCVDLIPYLETRLATPISFNSDLSFEARVTQVLTGELNFSWLCGLLYTQLRDEHNASIEALAAPIFVNHSKPIYSSYLIVNKKSPFHSTKELQGLRLAINEEGSFSGHHLIRYSLRQENLRFKLVKTGSHASSIHYVSEAKADFAAIDTTLYDYLQRQKPESLTSVRIIKRLENFPVPPLIVHHSIPLELKSKLLSTLLNMPKDNQGKILLGKHSIKHFVVTNDLRYNSIRQAVKAGKDLSD